MTSSQAIQVLQDVPARRQRRRVVRWLASLEPSLRQCWSSGLTICAGVCRRSGQGWRHHGTLGNAENHRGCRTALGAQGGRQEAHSRGASAKVLCISYPPDGGQGVAKVMEPVARSWYNTAIPVLRETMSLNCVGVPVV